MYITEVIFYTSTWSGQHNAALHVHETAFSISCMIRISVFVLVKQISICHIGAEYSSTGYRI